MSYRDIESWLLSEHGLAISYGSLQAVVKGRTKPSRQLAEALGVIIPSKHTVTIECSSESLVLQLRQKLKAFGHRRRLGDLLALGVLTIEGNEYSND